jgi:hypothetical protein
MADWAGCGHKCNKSVLLWSQHYYLLVTKFLDTR